MDTVDTMESVNNVDFMDTLDTVKDTRVDQEYIDKSLFWPPPSLLP